MNSGTILHHSTNSNMLVAFIIVILLSLGCGGYLGFRLGAYHIRKENQTLHSQLQLQERFSRTWAAEATDKYTLSQQVASHQTTNLANTMQMVIQVLNNYQQQNGTTNQLQNEKVSELIAKAKAIGSLHE